MRQCGWIVSCGLAFLFHIGCGYAQTPLSECPQGQFSLQRKSDSLAILTLTTDSTSSQWTITEPVYRFCTGDVDGDGSVDAMVGVVRKTRYFREEGHRIWIFKNYHGLIRPLWMGSRLGGILQDFRFTDGKIRSLESTTDGKFVVAEYRWAHFGMGFERFLAKNVCRDEAIVIFEDRKVIHDN